MTFGNDKMENISRRKFLMGSGIALGTLAIAAGLPGCTTDASAEKEPAPSEFYDCDIVVCGTGTSGLCAASRAAELGADVIVVEALTENGIGGNSKYVESCWAPANATVIEAAYKSMTEYHKNMANNLLIRKFCENALGVLDWTMNNQEVKFSGAAGIESLSATSPAINYAVDDAKTYNPGKNAIMTMYAYCQKLGVRFVFDARAKELVTADDGSVRGVLCDRLAETRLQIDTKAVVLATGGFSANSEMFEEFTHLNYDSLIPYGTSGSQRGDAINMGLTLGAALHHPEAISYCSPVLPGHFNKSALVICGCNQADTTFFNQNGERFCDESCISDWALSGNIGAQQQHIYVVVDSDFVEKIETQGPVTKRTNYFKANEPVSTFKQEIDEAMKRTNPRVVRSDTIGSLAEQLDIDRDAFEKSITDWNNAVDTGVDTVFQKPSAYMRKIQTPPFYGFKTVLAWYGTVGGLKIDTDCRVVSKTSEVIPGLYAAGSDAAGLFGGCYDVVVAPGSCQMWARTSGKWSAEHAVSKYLPTLA